MLAFTVFMFGTRRSIGIEWGWSFHYHKSRAGCSWDFGPIFYGSLNHNKLFDELPLSTVAEPTLRNEDGRVEQLTQPTVSKEHLN